MIEKNQVALWILYHLPMPEQDVTGYFVDVVGFAERYSDVKKYSFKRLRVLGM